MRIVVAPDSFKGSLPAQDVARTMAEGLRESLPEAEYVLVPLADGGEGTVDALASAAGGERVTVTVTGPLGDPVEAAYALLDDGGTAVVEMASASGLDLVPAAERDLLRASTLGTGELVADALDRGARRIVLGVGGSGTNDGGAGLLQALGARFLDATGTDLPLGGAVLEQLDSLDLSGLHPAVGDTRVELACDVDNPLLGARGATAVYGPQKGGDADDLEVLERALARLADVVATLGPDRRDESGAGAGGGLGFGAMAVLGASARPGIDVVTEAVGLREALVGADLVVTGEGCIDGQTLHGKAPAGVLALAREQGVPVVMIGGSLGEDVDAVTALEGVAVFGTVPRPGSVEDQVADATARLRSTAAQVARLWSLADR